MKKKTFQFLRVGAKFRFERKLYIKTDFDLAAHLSTGEQLDFDFICPDERKTLVTPVKVSIRAI